jgi:ribosome-binding factor A
MSTRRQQKVGSLIQEELSGVFQKHGATYYGSAFVTITGVEVSPDLLVAKIYLSIYNVKDKNKALDAIIDNTHEIRRQLGNKMRFHLRRIPELIFYLDESIENAIRVNELLKGIDRSSGKK